MTTISINLKDLDRLRAQLDEQVTNERVGRVLADAIRTQAERLVSEAFAGPLRTPPPRPSSNYWRPQDTAWSPSLHANCRCVVVPIEADYIEADYTVGDARRVAGLLEAA